MKLLLWLKNWLAPDVSPEVDCEMDRSGVESVCYVSLAVFALEFFAVMLYMFTHSSTNAAVVVSVASGLFCCACCLVGFVFARDFIRQGRYDHVQVTAFKAIFFVVMSLWGAAVSVRHYAAGDQMLTFFTVELMMACFFVFRPWASVLLVGGACSVLYAALSAIDGAAHINTFNFLLFTAMAAIGMSAHFHLQRLAAQRLVTLHYVGLHDELTGLHNRKALEEDVAAYADQEISLYMVDINYFKELNDQCGHLVGDHVLKLAAEQLAKLWPGTRAYRYGGDEFLVIGDACEASDEVQEQYSFTCGASAAEELTVALSVGCATGTPHSKEDLFALIGKADRELYRSKAHAHGHTSRKGLYYGA